MENGQEAFNVHGYDKLARFLGGHPQMMIFRLFSTLGAKYTLYLQAELSHLEKDLEDASRADSEAEDGERRNYQNSWWNMHRARKYEDWQIQRVNEVGKALDKYCEIISAAFALGVPPVR
ncbi:hypothetical protein GP486_001642 [Trichoglossum hirsutum]|uniref:DUF6594 domain-containing protein n=1 Tax=Trichoglossum hirsutum TaxID=265104 RepID=A0A9P8LGI9_9PEZI|nr:hypothetical protein GP486_001642 [Trichoglossum hirsutum]